MRKLIPPGARERFGKCEDDQSRRVTADRTRDFVCLLAMALIAYVLTSYLPAREKTRCVGSVETLFWDCIRP